MFTNINLLQARMYSAVGRHLGDPIRRWPLPHSTAFVASVGADMIRSKAELVGENALLRSI